MTINGFIVFKSSFLRGFLTLFFIHFFSWCIYFICSSFDVIFRKSVKSIRYWNLQKIHAKVSIWYFAVGLEFCVEIWNLKFFRNFIKTLNDLLQLIRDRKNKTAFTLCKSPLFMGVLRFLKNLRGNQDFLVKMEGIVYRMGKALLFLNGVWIL